MTAQDHTDVSFVFVRAKPATSATSGLCLILSLHKFVFPTLDLQNVSLNLEQAARQELLSKFEIKQELINKKWTGTHLKLLIFCVLRSCFYI